MKPALISFSSLALLAILLHSSVGLPFEDIKGCNKNSTVPGCKQGPAYWCESAEQADECQAVVLCRGKYGKDNPILRKDPCLFGPAHWCSTTERAIECNVGDFCREEYRVDGHEEFDEVVTLSPNKWKNRSIH